MIASGIEVMRSYLALFVLALVVFTGPMLIFVPKLLALKQRGLMEYGTLGSEYTQAFHRMPGADAAQ